MTFAARETSRTLGAPIALFLFRVGPADGDAFAYTTSEDPVTYQPAGEAAPITFGPVPINRDTIQVSGALDRSALEVRLAKSLGIVAMFTPWPPSTVVRLKILEGHVGESEFKVIWAGRVLGSKMDGDEGVLMCKPISSSLRRSGLRGNYEFGCRHMLYGPSCRADKASATIDVVVSAVNNPYVELPSGWASSPDRPNYVNGVAEWTNAAGRTESRSIIHVTSSTEIQLNGDISTLAPGMTLALSLGCDHQETGCTLHDNLPNFGGKSFMPLKNPFGITNNFV